MKLIKRLFCKHKVLKLHTVLVKQKDGSWKADHKLVCQNCGKVI